MAADVSPPVPDMAAAPVAVSLLKDVARALAGGDGLDVMLDACAQAVVHHVGAAFVRIWTLERGASMLVLRASAGQYTSLHGAHATIPVGSFKIGRIAEQRQPHRTNDLINDPELRDPAWARREGMTAFAGYPLLVGDDLVGVLGLFARVQLSPSIMEVLEAVADATALGIRRSAAERELRAQAEVAETLYRAGTAVARVHGLDPILQTVTDLATSLTQAQFGAFFYNAVDERGEAYTLYTLSGVPREAFSKFPLPRNTAVFDPTFQGTSIERHADITADPRFGKNAPYHGMPRGHLPVRSYLAVPVVSRTGEVFGGLFFGHAQVGVFDDRAERLAVGIAGHASAAIDSARLFEAEHRLALNFQRTLLAGDLPDVPGVRIARRYVPASVLAEVGGDWHDTALLPDGDLAVTVGDVVGHDLRAAVTMGRLRNAIQLYALDGHGAAETLRLADRYLQRLGCDDLATVVHARYTPETGRLVVSRAGHPPPVIWTADGNVHALDHRAFGSSILGLGAEAPAGGTAEIDMIVEPGSIVVFFTDGLVERRHEPLDDGIERLKAAVVHAAARETASFCDALIAKMIDGELTDDIAVLALFIGP